MRPLLRIAAGIASTALLAGCSSAQPGSYLSATSAVYPSGFTSGAKAGQTLTRLGSMNGAPTGLALPPGTRLPNVYVADAGNNAVYEILFAGGFTQILTLGSGFNGPSGVAVDKRGDVFVADNKNNAVKEMVAVDGGIPKNPVIKTLTTKITTPYNVALDQYRNVFVTNNVGSVVYELLASSHYKTINQLGSFTFPTSVAVDSFANVYVGTAASTSEVFEMLAPSYTTVNVLGGGFGEFLNPYGLAVDLQGNVLVGDATNSAVKMMPPNCFSTSCVTTLTTQFLAPVGVAVDKNGNVYGGDTATGEVFQIVKAGGYQTIIALGSGFSNPWGIAVH